VVSVDCKAGRKMVVDVVAVAVAVAEVVLE
jgi:hypothetical protein